MAAETNKYFIRAVFHQPDAVKREILTALLAESGWEGFDVSGDELVAFIPENKWNAEEVEELIKNLPFPVIWEWEKVKERNWNALWESQIQPLETAGVYIRTDFHPPAPPGKMEIVITPEMSFGTGHHATTRLMLEMLAEENLQGRSVIDMGTGTGILAIYAAKKGARPVYAIDNDEWAYRNALENVRKNHVPEIQVLLGDASALEGLPPADFFLANINRNILMRDLPVYVRHLKPGGKIMLSGFYPSDEDHLEKAARDAGLRLEKKYRAEGWSGMKFVHSIEKK